MSRSLKRSMLLLALSTTAVHAQSKVKEVKPGAAAGTGWLIVEGRGKGGAFAHRYRFTDTWVRRKAGWRLVVAQDSLVPN